MKRRAAPNRQAAGVSLFPFLAVLLCTMGALIVVLVVIARQARVQVAEAAQPPADDQLAIKRADLEWRISQLRESREATKKLLADKQTELGHLEEHSRRLRDQLDELAAARERLNQTAAGDERDQAKLKSELDRLHYRVAGLRNELGKLMEKAREKQQSYAVIPYHGPNETYRRPIYIECRSTGVVFQPSGLTLTEQDFAIDAGMGSPLASALRAAKEYYRGNALKGEGEMGSAYPLLIVRPDGILAYDFAKQVLDESGLEFGYELVAQDWSIEFPPADPMLVMAMKQAVGEGRMRLAYLAGAAPGLFFNRRDVSFRAVSHGGAGAGGGPGGGAGLHRGRSMYSSGRPAGIRGGSNASGSAAGGTGAADNPYLDALAQEESGKGPGIGKGSGFGVQGSAKGSEAGGQRPGGAWPGGQGGSGPAGTGGMGGIGISSGNAGEPFAANGDHRSGTAGRGPGLGGPGSARGAQGPGSRREVAGFAHDGSESVRGGSGIKGQGPGSNSPGGPSVGVALNGGPPGNRPPPFKAGASGGATNARGVGAGRELASASGTETGPGAGGQSGIDARVAGGNARSSQGGVAMATQTGTGPATRAGAIGGASASGSPDTAGTALATDDGMSRGNAAAGGPAGSYAAGTSMRASAAGQLASTARGGSGASGPAADGSTQRGGVSSGSGASGGSSSGGASGSNGASSSAGSPGGGSMGSNMMQPGQLGMPMPTISMGAQPPSNQASPSHRPTKRERNWANPDASTSNVPIERRIHIICDAEHLTIMPEGRGARGMKVIKLGTHTEDSLDELVSAVWDKIDSWGTAGRGMYWRPKLQMVIEPGGQRRYTELQALLVDSGFDVHGRPRTVKQRR